MTSRPAPSTRFSTVCSKTASSGWVKRFKDDMANRICAQLLMLAAEDPKKDIWLYINSPGGSITAGMAIYDTMQLIDLTWRPWAWACVLPWASSC